MLKLFASIPSKAFWMEKKIKCSVLVVQVSQLLTMVKIFSWLRSLKGSVEL
jgi:hypothetical protein